MKKRKMFFRMITASLMRRRSRMIVALLAIAIGAAILSGLVTIYYDVPRQMGAQFRNYGANVIFTPSEGKLSGEVIDEGLSLIRSDELVGATPYRYETVRIHEQPIMAAGTSMEDVKKTSPYWLVEGEWPAASGEIMVGQGVAESLQLKEGDTVAIRYTEETEEGAEEEAADNEIDYKVTAVLSTGGSEEDYVYMNMEGKQLFDQEFDYASAMNESISAVKSGDKWRLFNAEGNSFGDKYDDVILDE